ncbi:DUF1656 domain-containing protein [Halomonas sp. WWR20]
MELKEIAIGGVYFSPLLLYALLGFCVALVLRTLLYRLLRHNAPWFEAWFDVSLFVIAMAACAFLSSTLT